MKRIAKPISPELRKIKLRKLLLRAVAEFHEHSSPASSAVPMTQRSQLAYVAGFEAASCLNLLGGLLTVW
jgi:hypothetical protein